MSDGFNWGEAVRVKINNSIQKMGYFPELHQEGLGPDTVSWLSGSMRRRFNVISIKENTEEAFVFLDDFNRVVTLRAVNDRTGL